MKKFIKIVAGIIGGLALLVTGAAVVVPRVVDIQKYKPLLLEKISEATGLKVSLGGDLHLSLFPWVGVDFQDLRLGNPPGFGDGDFMTVTSFEAHVKLIPLLKKDIQVSSFIVNEPSIALVVDDKGRANWQSLLGSTGSATTSATASEKGSTSPLIHSLAIDELTILNGRLSFVDRQRKISREVTGFTLRLTDVSQLRPVALTLNSVIDGKSLAVNGTIGPVGIQPGQGKVPFDLHIAALDQLSVNLQGQLEKPAGDLSYTFTWRSEKFSPRKLLAALDIPLPIVTADQTVLAAMTLDFSAAGTRKKLEVTKGQLGLDGSRLDFSTSIDSFAPLNLQLEAKLDSIDLDRYLPPRSKESAPGPAAAQGGGSDQAAIDYRSLRQLVIDGKLVVDKMKIKGGTLQNVQLHLAADHGVFELNPFAMELYGGNVASTATVDVRQSVPVSRFELRTTNVQVGPLLKDFAGKDSLEGNLVSNIALNMRGDTALAIKKSLSGKGELLFTDGAIVGLDLAGMVRNVQASFGLAEATTAKPRTDFAELRIPFTITDGLVNTPGTTMQSPLLRVVATGDVDLVAEQLNLRVQPRFVATLKGQGDVQERKGVMVPVLVQGSFARPEFTPDLAALLQGQLPDGESVKKALEEQLAPGKIVPTEKGKAIEEGIKKLIPNLKLQ
ncbi:MAG: AsmA family protein [Desulfopila sp.]